MKITYVSTYLPQKCGIATCTDYLIWGIEEVDPASALDRKKSYTPRLLKSEDKEK